MSEVVLTTEVQESLRHIPVRIVARVQAIFDRLRRWPSVSGAKPLRDNLKGNYRIRTGDWRVLFRVFELSKTAEPRWRVTVWRIDNRRDVYED